MKIASLHVSPGHNFFGHHGKPAGTNDVVAVPEVHCVAGSGLRDDRFFDYKRDYAGQITFFAEEIHHALLQKLPLGEPRSPAAYRRNVVTRGVDLNGLIGREFSVQGVRFSGSVECKPCYWMDQAVAPGAEEFLKGNGGLRARILSDGVLRIDCATPAGLLLAGGRSTRMGRDKGSLAWGDRTLREHQAATLARSGAWPLLYSCRGDQSGTPAGFERIEDRADAGALDALADSFNRHAHEVVTVLAIDLPRMTASQLTRIAGIARDEKRTVVPVIDGRFEPFAAAWHRSAAAALSAAARARRSLQDTCASLVSAELLRAEAIEGADTTLFANMNTPSDWDNR